MSHEAKKIQRSMPQTDRSAHRASWRARAAGAVTAAGFAYGMLVGLAHGNEVARFETACGNYQCTDTFELKCPQPTNFLCIDLETEASDEPIGQTYSATVVTSAPVSLIGAARTVVFSAGSTKTVCLTRSGGAGAIRALLTVAASGSPATIARYTARVECFSGNILDGLASRKTKLKVRQDQ